MEESAGGPKKGDKTLDKNIHDHAYYEYLFSTLFKHVNNIVHVKDSVSFCIHVKSRYPPRAGK